MEAPLEIPTKLVSWPRSSSPRIAGVSSFGFSGTNAHVIIEEGPGQTQTDASQRGSEILCLSARSKLALMHKAREIVDFLEREPQIGLPEVSCALSVGRKHFPHRLSMTGKDIHSVRQELQDWLDKKTKPAFLSLKPSGIKKRKVAYLFSGLGLQHTGTGKILYETQQVFRNSIDRCADMLSRFSRRSLQAFLFNEEHHSEADYDTVYAQPALFALQYALAKMLEKWGILPFSKHPFHRVHS